MTFNVRKIAIFCNSPHSKHCQKTGACISVCLASVFISWCSHTYILHGSLCWGWDWSYNIRLEAEHPAESLAELGHAVGVDEWIDDAVKVPQYQGYVLDVDGCCSPLLNLQR